MIRLGLTGSIGMGKSTTAQMFRDAGVPVYDADAAVHELYDIGGKAVAPVTALFDDVSPDGFINRAILASKVLGDSEALAKLEAVVHPLVGAHRATFFSDYGAADIVVLDVPLLFETGGDKAVDAVVVVTAPFHVQQSRVLARPGMSEDKFESIRKRQFPDAEKRDRADFIIDTSIGLEDARRQVSDVLATLRSPEWRLRNGPLDAVRGAGQ